MTSSKHNNDVPTASPPGGMGEGPAFKMKMFDIAATGFGRIEPIVAASRGKATAKAYRAYQSYNDAATFKDFLKIVTVKKSAHPNPPRFGEKIIVSGREAFYICQSSQYVEFVLPYEDVTHLSHPSDVSEAPATLSPEQGEAVK